MNVLSYLFTGRRPERPDLQRPWRVWDLDSELRYMPVVRALPRSTLPICEVGSGPQGLAVWTPRQIIGIDPGDDDRHSGLGHQALANFERVQGDGAHIPLADGSVAAAVGSTRWSTSRASTAARCSGRCSASRPPGAG